MSPSLTKQCLQIEILFEMMQDEGNTQLIIFSNHTLHVNVREHMVILWKNLKRLKQTPWKDRVHENCLSPRSPAE